MANEHDSEFEQVSKDIGEAIEEASRLRDLGQYRAAIGVLEPAAALHPQNHELHLELAEIYSRAGYYEDSASAFISGHGADRDDPDIVAAEAFVIRQLACPDEARTITADALEVHTKSARLHAQHGWVAYELHEYGEALERFKNAVRLFRDEKDDPSVRPPELYDSRVRDARRGRRLALMRVGIGPMAKVVARSHDWHGKSMTQRWGFSICLTSF